jgi:hypothetical protein
LEASRAPRCEAGNIGGRKEQEASDISKLSDAELIQQLTDQAKQLGVEIDLSYSFAQRQNQTTSRKAN